jgi:chaperone required for assembly of F1-ATPase
MKRFYKIVSTAVRDDGAHAVMLDGKSMKTPGMKILAAPNAALAAAVMAEWAAQGDMVDPETMPLTQILTTALDRAIPQRAEITADILGYLDTDLVCYRTTEPPELAAAQAAAWDPALVWFAGRFGVPLGTTTNLSALTQPVAAHEAAARTVAAMGDYEFAAFQLAVAITGSLVLALGFAEGAFDANTLYKAMHVEEDYKAALYNEDFYGRAPHQEKREKGVRRDLTAAQQFKSLL